MVRRNCSYPLDFYCITEDPSGLDTSVEVIPPPNKTNLSGWWLKPYVFSSDFPVGGTLLFLDLDIVIIKNIDDFWHYSEGKFCIIRDFTRSTIPNWMKFNSSVFRLESGKYSKVWDDLVKDEIAMKKMHGDQDWIYEKMKSDYAFWPDEWCQSYKWEVRNRSEIVGAGRQRTFSSILTEPKIKKETKILVFHGDPKPEQVKDPIVIDNWR